MPAPRVKAKWKGAASLRGLLKPTDGLSTHPQNPRRGNLDVIAASLERFGQLRPVVVEKATNQILAGNHTYRAATERLGWNRIAAVIVDVDSEEAKAYLLADNRTADVGGYDGPMLMQVLAELDEAGRLEGTGYSPDDLSDLIAEQDALAEEMRRADGFEPSGDEPPRLDQRSPWMILQFADQDRLDQFKVYVSILRKELEAATDEDAVFEVAERQAKLLSE